MLHYEHELIMFFILAGGIYGGGALYSLFGAYWAVIDARENLKKGLGAVADPDIGFVLLGSVLPAWMIVLPLSMASGVEGTMPLVSGGSPIHSFVIIFTVITFAVLETALCGWLIYRLPRRFVPNIIFSTPN